VLVLALALPVAASAQHDVRIDVPAVPSNLRVEAGHVPYLQTRAYGTQNYFCQSNATWKLYGPQATLYPGNLPFQIATHFLSPNPEEQGVARATWMHSHDGSAVWAAKIEEAPAAGAIPWLLLAEVGTIEGTIGSGLLAQTTFIQRVNTLGGLAPQVPCAPNALALVPYETDYIFYRAEKK
jgi:Protein of unknown function (DUF3455)